MKPEVLSAEELLMATRLNIGKQAKLMADAIEKNTQARIQEAVKAEKLKMLKRFIRLCRYDKVSGTHYIYHADYKELQHLKGSIGA